MFYILYLIYEYLRYLCLSDHTKNFINPWLLIDSSNKFYTSLAHPLI